MDEVIISYIATIAGKVAGMPNMDLFEYSTSSMTVWPLTGS